ncbi:MAG: DUF2306 domain-containing protein [Planctomycetaceae bacterium]
MIIAAEGLVLPLSIHVRRMHHLNVTTLQRILKLLVCALIGRVVIGVWLSYADYMPPNFEADFLQGREPYFFGSYQWAFYTHILSGPCSLVLGMILTSNQFRLRFTKWHRRLGRIQIVCVLSLVAPSGLWMACYAMSGAMAGTGFAALAVATAMCVAFGWRSAVNRRFAEHQRWMWRCFILLCSAVVLRVIGGLTITVDIESEWAYPLAAWISWLLPLLAYEAFLKLASGAASDHRYRNSAKTQ